MNTLLFIGFVFLLIGYHGLSTVDKTNPKLSKHEVILAIVFLLGIICLTSSITLYIVF